MQLVLNCNLLRNYLIPVIVNHRLQCNRVTLTEQKQTNDSLINNCNGFSLIVCFQYVIESSLGSEQTTVYFAEFQFKGQDQKIFYLESSPNTSKEVVGTTTRITE